ncbi:sulfite exporter TauE/SafE family protein [Methylobacterium sp. sgz302541]|uniref:sulfite exporter TauE/SafE family protein n=1 Tax=unclassified Methylobacterium TaxID=2615210 RepID=UPI003D343DE5
MGLVFILVVGLVAGVVSGIVGTGSSIMLVPVLAAVYGPKEAVPIMAVAALIANVSRVLAWWREVDGRAFAAYAGTGAPAAVLGARTLLVLPPRAVDIAIGLFLLAMIPARHAFAARFVRLSLAQVALAGALIGFLTGIVVSTGPISVPVFVGYGLAKGAFIGTEAAGSLAVYAAKTLTFRGFGALPADLLAKGLVVGGSLMAGAFIAKPFVMRLSPDLFRRVMDGLMLVSGLGMLWSAWIRP